MAAAKGGRAAVRAHAARREVSRYRAMERRARDREDLATQAPLAPPACALQGARAPPTRSMPARSGQVCTCE